MEDKVVVTGGAGFIGSHLVRNLVERGYKVMVLDNLFRGRESYLRDLVASEKITFVKGDVRNSDIVSDVLKGAKFVFHKAAVCINYSLANPAESFEINVQGSFNVFRAAKEHGVKKVIFASSASVYGNPVYVPMNEDHPFQPITPYCISKMTGEFMLRMKGLEGLKYVVYRYFNVYGVRQSIDAYYTSVIISFVRRVLAGLPPQVSGDGSQSMDFINVKDVVEADILAMESDIENEVFNVGSGTSTSVKDLATKVIRLVGADVEPQFLRGNQSIVQRRQADITKIKRELGFRPKVSLDEGLRELIEDIKLNPKDC